MYFRPINQNLIPLKNILKLTFILSIVIVFTLNTSGQQQFGIKASGGISRLYGSLESYNYYTFATSTSFNPSIQAGIYYHLPTGKKTSLGAELLYSKVQGGQMATWDYYFNNDRVSYGSYTTYEDISYLSLPVYFGVTFKRLTINGGFQFSYVLSSSGRVKTNSEQTTFVNNDNPRALYASNRDHDLNNLNIREVDFGLRAGVVYRLTNKLSMEGMFYYGLNNINLLPSSEDVEKV